MTQSRIETFQEMLKTQPEDVMIWYGLGGEYSKVAQWPEAIEAFRNVIRLNPDYTAAYQMLGTALINHSLLDEAKSVWQEGIQVAVRTGAWKAKQHMEGLLANANNSSGFCSK